MNKKIATLMAFVTLLLFLVTAPNPAYSQPLPTNHPSYYVYVDPANTADPTLTPGKNYTISVKTNYTGNDVCGYEFTLMYNPLVLNGVEVSNGDLIPVGWAAGRSPWDFEPGYENTAQGQFSAGTFDNNEGELSLTMGYFTIDYMPMPVVSGPKTLAYVTFQVIGLGDSYIILGSETALFGYTDIRWDYDELGNELYGGWGTSYEIIDASVNPENIGHGYFCNTEAPPIHDVAIIGVTASPTIVEAGDIVEITVVVQNEGTVAEIFEVNVYYNKHFDIVPTKTVRGLEADENKSLAWTWNTTDVPVGDHNIKAVAKMLSRENNTNDNTYTDGTVRVVVREDFTTYTEVDPNSHINITANHIDHDAYGNEDAYIYKDRGAEHFTNFTHLVDVRSDFLQVHGLGVVWMLSNEVDDWTGLLNEGKTAVRVAFYHDPRQRWLQLSEAYGRTEYHAQYAASADTWYYLKIQKSGTNLTCEIYSDPDRTILLDILNMTLHADHSFRYIFASNTANTRKNKHLNSDVEKLYLLEQALEDFNHYEEVDPNDHIFKTGVSVSFLGLMRNETAYVYKDMGFGYFRDFKHFVDFEITGMNASSSSDRVAVALWMLTNTLGALSDAPHHLSIRVRQKGTNTTYYNLELAEERGNTSLSVDLEVGIRYYLTITRTNGSVSCTIYLTSLRTVEVDSLTITGANMIYQYIQVGTSPRQLNDPNDTVDGYVMNLCLDARMMTQTNGQLSSESILFSTIHLAIPEVVLLTTLFMHEVDGFITFKPFFKCKAGSKFYLFKDIVEILKNNLEKIGIDLRYQFVDTYAWFELISGANCHKTWQEAGGDWEKGWDMTIRPWQALPTDLVGYDESYSNGYQPPNGWNYYDWQNAQADRLLQEAMQTLDAETKKEKIGRWQERFMLDPPQIPLYYAEGYDITSALLENWDPTLGWRNGWSLKRKGKTLEDNVTIRWGSSTMPDNFNPLFADQAASEVLAAQTFDTLLKMAKKPNTEQYYVVPSLASDLPTYSEGPNGPNTRVTVTLRSETVTGAPIKWHDGQLFTAEDVKFTFDAARELKIGNLYSIIDSVGTSGSYTVVFNLKKPYAAFNSLLTMIYIIPEHIMGDVPLNLVTWLYHPTNQETPDRSNMVGTGPFKFKEKSSYMWKVEVNKDYFLGESCIDYVECWRIGSHVDGWISLRDGTIDFGDCWFATIGQINDARADVNLNVIKENTPIFHGVEFNLHHPDLSNRYLRLAIAHAIPYDFIIGNVLPNYGYIGSSARAPIFPIQYYTEPAEYGGQTVSLYDTKLARYEYDIDKAMRYMELWWHSKKGTVCTKGPLGDADFSGFVEMPDYYLWVDWFGKTTGQITFLPGQDVDPDFDNSGLVAMLDYYNWTNRIGWHYP